jgi:hypothetical protein
LFGCSLTISPFFPEQSNAKQKKLQSTMEYRRRRTLRKDYCANESNLRSQKGAFSGISFRMAMTTAFILAASLVMTDRSVLVAAARADIEQSSGLKRNQMRSFSRYLISNATFPESPLAPQSSMPTLAPLDVPEELPLEQESDKEEDSDPTDDPTESPVSTPIPTAAMWSDFPSDVPSEAPGSSPVQPTDPPVDPTDAPTTVEPTVNPTESLVETTDPTVAWNDDEWLPLPVDATPLLPAPGGRETLWESDFPSDSPTESQMSSPSPDAPL